MMVGGGASSESSRVIIFGLTGSFPFGPVCLSVCLSSLFLGFLPQVVAEVGSGLRGRHSGKDAGPLDLYLNHEGKRAKAGNLLLPLSRATARPELRGLSSGARVRSSGFKSRGLIREPPREGGWGSQRSGSDRRRFGSFFDDPFPYLEDAASPRWLCAPGRSAEKERNGGGKEEIGRAGAAYYIVYASGVRSLKRDCSALEIPLRDSKHWTPGLGNLCLPDFVKR